jgi:hypothetical protein
MYKRGADGVAKKGKTEGKNLGNSGPTVGTERGGKKAAGLTSEKMKAVGRGLAKVANQGG